VGRGTRDAHGAGEHRDGDRRRESHPSEGSLAGRSVHGRFAFCLERGAFATGTYSPTKVWATLTGRKKELNLKVRHEVVTKASSAN
jgi:hypothetical protein